MKLGEVARFLAEVKAEAKKVTWPEHAETVQATIGVVVMVLFVALFLWAVDSILAWIVKRVMLG